MQDEGNAGWEDIPDLDGVQFSWAEHMKLKGVLGCNLADE